MESAALFAELTDHEYQDLVVDPEDYAIRIADAGTEHELSRFSGSENDLASLSLRVAVSLVIAESAGELGLLVLDEVLGALDRERRERMLVALDEAPGPLPPGAPGHPQRRGEGPAAGGHRGPQGPRPNLVGGAAGLSRAPPGALASLRSAKRYPILRRPVCAPRVPTADTGNNQPPGCVARERHARTKKENTLWPTQRKRTRGRSRPPSKS